MRARFVNEAKIEPNRELFDKFKQTLMDIKAEGVQDPFAEINDRLNDDNIYFVDFKGHMENLSDEERKTMQRANMMPPLGIRLMGYDPPSGQLFIAVDESFDDKFLRINPRQLEDMLNHMWSGFGHETIHMGQVAKMGVQQDPKFNSQDEYFSNKQEIMAMAFSFVEEMRGLHSDEEILDLLRTDKINPPPPPPGMPRGMRPPLGMPPKHPLYGIYKKLGGKEFKLWSKYVYQYLQQNEEE